MAEKYNPYQMEAFGLDPWDAEDCALWFVTEPDDANRSVEDYSDDVLAYSVPPRQDKQTIVES